MQINKGNINLKQQVGCQSLSTLVEGDIILGDDFPDALEILCADAKVRVVSTECKNGKTELIGEVEFWALYVPEGKETELKCMEKTINFSSKLDIKADENTEFTAQANTEHIGFTLVNSRKLSLKVMVSVKVCAYQEKEYAPIIDICEDDIEKTEKTHSIYLNISRTQQDIEISDLLTVPDDMNDIAEILKVDAWVNGGDVKVMNGKAMLQAELFINTLYTSADETGSLQCTSHTIPFTEIVEAPGADEQCVISVAYGVPQISANIKGDLNGDTKIINIESIVCADISVSKTVSECFLDDCYFLSGGTETKHEIMPFSEYITSENERITKRFVPKIPQNINIEKIISCSAKPLLKEVRWENGAISVTGTLITYLIYRDDSGVVRSDITESELNWGKSHIEECTPEVKLNLESINAETDGKRIEILANVALRMKALREKEIKILTDCNKTEDDGKTSKPTMVVYFAKAGENIWDIAKKYRTKAEKIKIANALDKETMEKNKRLLIPMK